MATDTKIRKRSDPNALTQSEVDKKFDELTANLDPEKKEQQEHDREYVTHKLAEKAGERIRKLSLNIKASPELRKEIEELAHDIEGSVPRLAAKARTDDALITQIEAAVDKAEKYIISAAKEEEKRGKKEEEKRKEKDHKVHPHEPEKPESANKTPQEKAKEELDAFRTEVQKDTQNEIASSHSTPERDDHIRKAEALAEGTEGERKKDTSRGDSIQRRNITPQTVSQSPTKGQERAPSFKIASNPLAKQRTSARQSLLTPKNIMRGGGKLAAVRTIAGFTPIGRAVMLGSTAFDVGKKIAQKVGAQKQSPTQSEIMTSRINFIRRIINVTNTVTNTESGDIEEEYEEYGATPEVNDRGKNIQGNFRDSDSPYDAPQTLAGAGDEGGGSSDGNGGNGEGRRRGGLTAPIPHIPSHITPGSLGVPNVQKLTQGGVKGLTKEGAKLALKHPVIRGVIIAIIAVVLLIIFLIFVLAGGGGGSGSGQLVCNSPAVVETLTPQVTGPTTAIAGQTVPYQITVTDTQPSDEITVTATIPQGMSTTQTDVTSSWTRFTVAGNTITWKASENLPPNSLNPANFNFNVTLKALEAVPNATLIVNATPARAAASAPNPGTPGGQVPIAEEKSTEELKSIYGASAAEVEEQLVTIDFQGKQVKVHKKVQGIFEKVNREITAANTGYKFRLVGTYEWRQKNCPGGCSGLSTHSFGTTIDINWDTNPYTTANTHDIPPAVVDIFKNNGFEWGGDWGANGGSKDWMHFQYNGEPGAVSSVGGNCAAGGGGPVSADYVPPSDNACGGKYTANMSKNPTKKNFGDPICNFNKDALHNLLKTEDPPNADFWFNEVVRCESAYNPNAWASPSTGTPDPGGAWGLYQMGSSTPGEPGQPPPAVGRGGPNDRGDVPWVMQTKNAVSKGKQLGGTRASLARYWACAR